MSNHERNLVLVHFWKSGTFECVDHDDRISLSIALPVLPQRATSRWHLIIRGLIAFYLRCTIEILLNVV